MKYANDSYYAKQNKKIPKIRYRKMILVKNPRMRFTNSRSPTDAAITPEDLLQKKYI